MVTVRNFIGSLFALCIFAQLSTVHGKISRDFLWMKLSENNVKDVAPSGTNGEPLVVKHSLTIQRVLSWEDDILTLQVWEELAWKDSRLQWRPELFEDNVKELRIPSRSIWQPDILLYNSVEEYSGFVSGDLNAVVTFDGNVTLIPPRITKSFCFINESLLEENKEIACTLKYGSWTHTKGSLDLILSHPPTFNYDSNRYWHVESATGERYETQYACCPEIYVDVVYTLWLSRK